LSAGTRRSLSALWLSLSLAPALLLGALLARYAIDLPVGDAWYTPGNLYSALASERGVTIADLLAQHNESRKLFPRLIFLAIARLAGWNTRVELAVIFAVVCGIALALFALNRRTVADCGLAGLALALSCLLLFSPSQWENWAYTIQLVIFLPFLCVVACLLISRGATALHWKVAAAMLLSTVATYSSGSGMLCWVVAFVALFLRPHALRAEPEAVRRDSEPADRRAAARADTSPGSRLSRPWLLLVLFLAAWAGNLFVYFRDYTVYPTTSHVTSVIGNPIAALRFWLALAGSIVGAEDPLASELAGCAVIVLFASLAITGWRSARDASFEWTILGFHALATDLLIAAARFPDGPPSRYQSFSLYVWVAAFHLAAIVLPRRLHDEQQRRRWMTLVVSTVTLFLLLHSVSFARGAVHLANLSVERGRGRACLQFVDFNRDRPCFLSSLRIAPDDDILRNLHAASGIGLFDPPLARGNDLAPLAAGRPSAGSLDTVTTRRAGRGWRAEVRGRLRRCTGCEEVTAVVIAWESPDGTTRPFAVAPVTEEYADLSDVLRGFAHTGDSWSTSIDMTEAVPEPATRLAIAHSRRLTAWGVERRSGALHPMDGSAPGSALFLSSK
jgi:hypothetical protein